MNIIETREISLNDLVLDPETQIRTRTQPKVVKRYGDAMRAGSLFPAITVAPIVDGDKVRAFTLIDGWHRTTAARDIGRSKILADVVDAQPNEFLWLASQGNMNHGLQLTRADKRAVFRAYVKAKQHRNKQGRVKAAREISRDLQGSPSDKTISEWMRQDFPAVYREMGGGDAADEAEARDKQGLDPHYGDLASDALAQFWAAFRAISDADIRATLFQQVTRLAEDVAMTVTGTRELPVVPPDEF